MEGTTVAPVAAQAVDAPTMAEALRRTAENHGDVVAVRTLDDSVSLTWAQLLERVEGLAGGLASLGVGRGDCVAILLVNRPEFHVIDHACVTIGATPFSIYQTYSPEQIEYVISDSEARVAFTEQAFLPQLLEARKQLPKLEHVVVVDGDAPEGTVSLSDVITTCSPPSRRSRS
jgi:long-subunit acyl-CoA synthetase (AMP-forming)